MRTKNKYALVIKRLREHLNTKLPDGTTRAESAKKVKNVLIKELYKRGFTWSTLPSRLK